MKYREHFQVAAKSRAGQAARWMLAGLLALPLALAAQTVVVPTAYLNTEGVGGSSVLNNNIRLQEIHLASSLPGGPITITEIRFRPSARAGSAFTATISNINIRMSTTPMAPAALSATFAQNVGSNETVVFDGALSLSSAFAGAASGPKEFDLVILLTTPFVYDPSQGNLLIDYRNFSGSSVTYVDTGTGFDGKANRAFALGANSLTATTVDFGSEILQLIYAPVASAPAILTQPANRSVMLTATATFSVMAASAVPLTYQWRHDGVELAGGTGASLVLSNAQFADAGVYSVVVSNQYGSVTSSNAMLTVTNPPPPVLVSQPASQTVLPGNTALFAVGVVGVQPLTYQWRMGDMVLADATNSSLVLSNVQSSAAGSYGVVVMNPYGSATSTVAVLTVTNSDKLIVHPALAQQEAGGGSSTLFNNIRLQEVYASSLFPPGRIRITELRWRPSALYGQTSSTTISNIQLNLSTTPRQPGQLAATFSTNVGLDDTVVFHGPLAVSSAFAGPAGGPKDFDIVVPLSTPFLYDSSQGNLLLDVRNFSGSAVSAVDAGATPDHRHSRVFALGASTATSGAGDWGADVLQISYTSAVVPPYITAQPQSRHVIEGQTTTLAVTGQGASPLSYQWHFNGPPIADATAPALVLSNAQASASGDYLVIVTNALGSVTSQVATVTVDAARTLGLIAPLSRQEGSRITVVMALESHGDVAGITFVLRYDTNYLKEAQLNWSPDLQDLFNSVNYSPTGEVRASFALPAIPLPAGTQHVATVDFLLRSVPNDLDTALQLQILDVSDPLGDPITLGNLVRNASIHITRRLFVGDNNANNRLDVGDATVILRHLAQQEQTRAWDVVWNDLNTNGSLDSGDAIKALRAAAGIDPQPGGGGFTPAGNPANPIVPAAEYLVLSPATLRSAPGTLVTFQIRLQDIRTTISGAAFTLDYATNALRLLNASAYHTGPVVPGNALAIWNVAPSQNNFATQSGRISMAASSAGAWTSSNGVLAELTFQVQSGSTNRFAWPLLLRNGEVTPDGYANRFLLSSSATFIGRDPVPGSVVASVFRLRGLFRFTVSGDAGANYLIDASSNLVQWTTITNFLNSSGSYLFEDPSSATLPHRFYRARPGSN